MSTWEERSLAVVEAIEKIAQIDSSISLAGFLGATQDDVESMALEGLELEFKMARLFEEGADIPKGLDPDGVHGFIERHPATMTARELLEARKAAAGIR